MDTTPTATDLPQTPSQGQTDFDRKRWADLSVLVPAEFPTITTTDMLTVPVGCSLRATEVPELPNATALFGVLAEKSEESYTVIGQGLREQPKDLFVWTGTPSEFEAMWKCE